MLPRAGGDSLRVSCTPAAVGNPSLSRTRTWLGPALFQQHIPVWGGHRNILPWQLQKGFIYHAWLQKVVPVLPSCSPREGIGRCGHSSEHTQHGLGTAEGGTGWTGPFSHWLPGSSFSPQVLASPQLLFVHLFPSVSKQLENLPSVLGPIQQLQLLLKFSSY